MTQFSLTATKLGGAFALLASLAMATPSEAQTVRYQCGATGASDISMSARYEIRGTGPTARRKFSTEFEAAATSGFVAGNRLDVLVKGVNVGNMLLEKLLSGEVVGDLNFDTRPQADADPFPANWPKGVGIDSRVVLKNGADTVLGCRLR